MKNLQKFKTTKQLLKFYIILSSLLFIGSFLFISEASADTNVSGIISEDTTWSLASSPYIITGNTLIKENVVLTIEPGVIIKFAKSPIESQEYSIQIDGTLIAKGEKDQKIIFTSANSNPLPGDWGTIYFSDKSKDWDETTQTGSIVDYCVIEYGGNSQGGTSDIGSTLIQINNASPLIQNSTLRLSNFDALRISFGDPKIINNVINGGRIIIYGGTPYFSDNEISGGEGFYIGGGSPIITRNNIIANQGDTYSGGFRIDGGSPRITYNNIINNSKNGIGIINCLTSEMGCSPVINNNNIYNNERFAIMLFGHSPDIDAKNNWWGTQSTSSIDSLIYDQKDDYNLGLVNYEPFLTKPESNVLLLPDITPPIITLIGSSTINLYVGDKYIEPGYTASDDKDGNLTLSVVVGGDPVNTNKVGTYIVTYNVTDAAGNKAEQKIRTIIVNEKNSPSLTYSQTIILKSGWNIISTPRIVASHSFSTLENSNNFDIYLLDPSRPSKWATMADLGQTEFQPLYGYFINNKTGTDQSLVLNYLDNVSPDQRLFERTFNHSGWYSIGVANPTYVKKACSNTIQDDHNNSKILASLNNQYDSIIDLTDGNYLTDPNSVAVSDEWKSATPVDLDSIHDLRELKGYAIHMNSNNALYSGFQNTDDPSCPIIPAANITVAVATDNPLEGNIIGSTSGTSKVDLLKFNVKVENVNVTFNSGTITATTSDATKLVSVELWDGSSLVACATPDTGGAVSWSNFSLPISAGTTKTLTVKGVIAQLLPGYNTGDTIQISTGPVLTGVDTNGNVVTANGTVVTSSTMKIYLVAPTFAYVSKSVSVRGTNNQTHPQDIGDTFLTFSVTANGGDIYIPKKNATTTLGMYETLTKPTNATSSTSTTWTCNSPAVEYSGVDEMWRIPSGSTANCTFSTLVTNTNSIAGYFNVALSGVKWTTSATTTSSSIVTQEWGLTNINTGDFYLGN